MQAVEFDLVDARRLGREQGGGGKGQAEGLHKSIVTQWRSPRVRGGLLRKRAA